MFRVCKGISPKIMTEVFPLSQPLNYNIRHQSEFSTRIVQSVFFGIELLGYLGPKIWNLIPTQVKNEESQESFKSCIKRREAKKCPCRLCKTDIHQAGVI